jgi:tRNA A-37 threonylcarbamoyl transferase component Bud32
VKALEAGQVVANRYRLETLIGEGAMGAVFRAEDQTLKRQVAIKFLFVRGTRDPQAMVDQFLREARIAASIQHRNVIQTVDFGTVDQYQPFMVMELLNGESLGERLAREPPLSREQLIHIVSLTLRGLAAVHDAGIVHRDLKPQNIFLQRDADAVYPKILDFGISRSVEPSGDRPSAIATQEGMIVGTPDYMSPEQARGEGNIDKRADIYSMAAILFEGLTGRLPFEAETIGDLIVKIMTMEPPRACDVAPDVPQPMSDLVQQAMSKNREHRFADARAMRRALLAAAESAMPGSRRAMSMPPVNLTPAAIESVLPMAPAQAHAPAPPAAVYGGGGPATWGDFEGLNAPQILDDSRPLAPSASQAEAAPNQQRMVARADQVAADAPAPATAPVAGQELPPLELPPPTATSKRAAAAPNAERPARAKASGERPAAAQNGARSRKNGGKPALEAQGPGLELALDPLYAGSAAAMPDIDYDRVGPSAKKPAPQVGMRARPSRSRPQSAARPRVRTRRRWGAYVLPAIALLLLAYLMNRPPANSLPPAPVADTAGGAESNAGGIANSTADSGLRSLHVPTKSRRDHPGNAPPHMRDVVF